jgi:DNA-binding PadR family transcriptional regulator
MFRTIMTLGLCKGLLMLTELEGSVLSELHHRGRQTAFRVRRSFSVSPSIEWRGSAGAVYPAIKRMERGGMIEAEASGDGRATRLLSITAGGIEAMNEWACDPVRACSVGIDPFRMRAGIWMSLDPARRVATTASIRQELVESVERLASWSRHGDVIERTSVDLSLRLQRSRLAWLDDMAAAPI